MKKVKSYYEVLGLSPDATSEQIQVAYRRLARQTHPDVGETGDRERFLQVQEAWEVLACPLRRKQHDQALRRQQVARRRGAAFSGGVGKLHGASLSPWTDLFEQLRRRLEGGQFAARRATPHVELVLSAAEAARGGDFMLSLPLAIDCRWCGGSGRQYFGCCPACGGRGTQPQQVTVGLHVPPGVGNDCLAEVSLDRYGLAGRSLLVRFYVEP